MSNQQHTPGPWEISGGALRIFSAKTNEPIAFVLQCNPEDGLSPTPPKAIANARLIAAAPETAAERDRLREINAELLEAIKTLVKLHHDWDKGSAYVTVAFYEKNNAAIAASRDAIAKATGA